jgi:acyl carrier protein
MKQKLKLSKTACADVILNILINGYKVTLPKLSNSNISLRNLGLDSLHMYELVLTLEDTFSTSLPDETVNITTLEELIDAVWGALNA